MKKKVPKRKTIEKKKTEVIHTKEKASFIRRGLAYFIDLLIIGLISIPIVFSVALAFYYINPEKYENPVSQIKEALETEKTAKIEIMHKETMSESLSQEQEKKDADVVVIGKEFSWVYEIVIFYVYFTLCFFFWRGESIGKHILGLRVIKRDGSRISLWNAFERAHGYTASTLLGLMGFFQVFWEKEGLTMHDKIADTNVVRIKTVKVEKLARSKDETLKR